MKRMLRNLAFSAVILCCLNFCDSAKINTPRVLLPWFENLYMNFTFEIIEGGCYTWSLSRDDIIDLEPLYEDSWGHCSRAARVSVSKSCSPPGSVIILAEEVNTGEILRGDVDIDIIRSLKVVSTTWKLFVEEAPEAFEVVAYDDQGNTFSTLEGIALTWSVDNLGVNVGEDPIVTFVRWGDTDYEAPRSITELEVSGLRAYSVLLYGQAMGEAEVHVCLGDDICTDFTLQVVASVVLTPATAIIAPGDTLRYRVVRARAGRLTIQDVADTLYYMQAPDSEIASLEDRISLIRGNEIGTTTILLMSGSTEVATATLTVTEPHSIRVTLRPHNLLIRGEIFLVHCIVLDKKGHALTAGDEMLIRLSVEGEANVDLIRSTENGTLTDAVAQNAGPLTIKARLYSIAGRALQHEVEGYVSAVAVDPLQIIPPELYVAWTDTIQDVPLRYRGGGDEPVTWSSSETGKHSAISLSDDGVATVRGIGELDVNVHLNKYPYVRSSGRVWSAVPELLQVSSTGHARVNKPHHLHIALTATHPDSGELYNFHTCNCASFAVSLLEGPEPLNVTAALWVTPVEGACCVLQCSWASRGVSTVRVSRGRIGGTARVAVRAAPNVLWPARAAALPQATLPVLAEGESLYPSSSDPRTAEIITRDGHAPHRHPDAQLFTMTCRRKGDTRLDLSSDSGEEQESVSIEAACAPHVSRIRLEPAETPGNCSGSTRVWLRPGQEVMVKVTLFDAIGRELLDENGPKVTWEIEPNHPGLEYKATDRLFVATHPDFAPVPVPYYFYQLISVDSNAVGWTGTFRANIPEATATIAAKVVAPLECDPMRVNIAWEGESLSNIATVTGGSGRYSVETSKGVTATVENDVLNAVVPSPGAYDLLVTDSCVQGEKVLVEVNIEEVLSVEVSTARAVCVDTCVPLAALVRGVSHSLLSSSRPADWRISGHLQLKDNDMLCGVMEGQGRVRASVGGVWSHEVEVLVFPPLRIIPSTSRVPVGGGVKLRYEGGPPSHLATHTYRVLTGDRYMEVTSQGQVHGISAGKARVKLVATDIASIEMASAEAEVEVIPISGLRVRSATSTLLVGEPSGLWVEAEALAAGSLAALRPRVSWTVRDPLAARLYTTHADDLLERSAAEGISVRVVPLKPGVITIDVRVRNLGQFAESRSWDSSIEILGVSDIRASVEGMPEELTSGDRIALAVGSNIRMKSLPRGNWMGIEDGAFHITAAGELRATKPGHGVIIAQHKDERNNIYRETAIHVEVATPHYGTVEPSSEDDDTAVRIVLRNSIGRRLIAPEANTSASVAAHRRRAAHSALGEELLVTGLDALGSFVTFQASVADVTVTDEVWIPAPDTHTDRVVATGSWGVCLEGSGWVSSSGVSLYPGSGVTLAVLNKDVSTKHSLRTERQHHAFNIHQLPLYKMEFQAGEWPSTMVPLSMEASSLTNGPLLCSEEQKYALEGVQVKLPFKCRTKTPHTAEPVLDIMSGQVGCSIIPYAPITEASEVELCAEWEPYRTCTKVLLLPPLTISKTKVSLLNPPASFTVYGHPQALKLVKITSSPGLKLVLKSKSGEINVVLNNEVTSCGVGWVNVISRLTAQEIRVEVERECDVACGTLLGALFSLLKPYVPTLMTIAAVAAAYLYIQSRLAQKAQIRMPMEPTSVFPPPPSPLSPPSPSSPRGRVWASSPYPSPAPVYGEASPHPDNSFSPNSTRMHSRFL